jgi:hypothetical protein
MQDQIKAGSWLVGPPEYIVETLLDIQHRWPGLTEVNIGHPVGTPKQVVLDNLERFAAEVMPAFQRRSSQTPVAAGCPRRLGPEATAAGHSISRMERPVIRAAKLPRYGLCIAGCRASLAAKG